MMWMEYLKIAKPDNYYVTERNWSSTLEWTFLFVIITWKKKLNDLLLSQGERNLEKTKKNHHEDKNFHS